MRSLLIVVGLALSIGLMAQDRVYKRVNPDGSVEYSDQPIENAEVMKVPKGSTFTMPSTSAGRQARSNNSQRATDEPQGYESLEITSPGNDEAIRSNDGRVSALAKSNPSLLSGHRFRWKLDGADLPKELTDPVLLLKEVDRGTHKLSVAIVDNEGNTLISSEPVVFHLLRASAGN